MTIFLKTSIAAAAAAFALAGLARAESITVSLAGKDARAVHAEIVKAAYQVCREVAPDSIALTGQADCISDTIAKADEDARGRFAAPVRKAELLDALRSAH